MSALTPEQEARVREIAIETGIAIANAQAGNAARSAIDRFRVSRSEVEASLSECALRPFATETTVV